MLIMNEVKEAEIILETNKFNKFTSALSLLIRYYAQIKEYHSAEIRDAMKNFIKLNNEEYSHWEELINKMIKSAKKFPLSQIDEIPLTQKELDVVASIPDKKKQKVLFTFLVLAKFKYIKSGKAWVNNTGASTFEIANSKSVKRDRSRIIYELKEMKVITLSKSPLNRSVHLEFIDEDGEPALIIKDLRNLGYRWLQYCGERYIECNECGILFKPTRMNNCYCKSCRGYIPLKTKIVECIECGTSFEAPATSPGKRCSSCSKLRRQAKQRDLMRKRKNLA